MRRSFGCSPEHPTAPVFGRPGSRRTGRHHLSRVPGRAADRLPQPRSGRRARPQARGSARRHRARPRPHCRRRGPQAPGTFNERVLEAAENNLKTSSAELLVVGDRGAMVATERGLAFDWSAPMVAHADEVPMLASRITDALYARLEKGQATRLTVVHAEPAPSASIEIVNRALLPCYFARFNVIA